jgi:hypothetical protein
MLGLLLRKVKQCTVLRIDAPIWNQSGRVRGVARKNGWHSIESKEYDMSLFIFSLKTLSVTQII